MAHLHEEISSHLSISSPELATVSSSVPMNYLNLMDSCFDAENKTGLSERNSDVYFSREQGEIEVVMDTRLQPLSTEIALDKRSVTFGDLPTLSSTTDSQFRPRIEVKLQRIKSSPDIRAQDQIKENQPEQISEKNVTLPHEGVGKSKKYWKRVRSLFIKKSENGSESTDSLEEGGLSPAMTKSKIPRTSSLSSESSSESLSENKITSKKDEKQSIPGPEAKMQNSRIQNDITEGAALESVSDCVIDLTTSKNRCREQELEIENNFSKTIHIMFPPPQTRGTQGSNTRRRSELNHEILEYSITLHHHVTAIIKDDISDCCVLKDATGVYPMENGQIITTDILTSKLVLFDATGYPSLTFALETGSEPWAMCMSRQNVMAVTLKCQGCVSLWSMDGAHLRDFGQGFLNAPTGIQLDSQERFVVVDECCRSVLLFSVTGQFLGELTSLETTSTYPLRTPRSICLDLDGNYVIADSGNHSIKIFDKKGNFCRQFGKYGRKDGEMRFPYCVAVDKAGLFYVSDHFNNRLSLFSNDGAFLSHLLTSADGLYRPKSVAIRDSLVYVTHGDLRARHVSVFHMVGRKLTK